MIESNLNALAVAPEIHQAALDEQVHPSELIPVTYSESQSPGEMDADRRLCKGLADAARFYSLDENPYMLDLRQRNDARAQLELCEVTLKQHTFCRELLRTLKLRAAGLQKELGPTMARWYIVSCIQRFRQKSTRRRPSCQITLNKSESI